MCSYYAIDTTGASVLISPTDKISTIAGVSRDLYVIDVKPLPVGGIVPTIIQGEVAAISTQTFSGGTVTTGTAKNFKAQVHFRKSREHSSKRTPDGPEAKGYLIVRGFDMTKVSKLLEVVFADSLEGKAFANTYAFARVSTTYTGADPDAGDPGTATPTPASIAYQNVDLSEQYEDDGPRARKIGDAMVIVDRSVVSEAQLTGAEYFTLTPQGGSAIKYTLWNSDGIKFLKTHHYAIYLKRLQQ
jgi:hypothetical protein